MEVPWSLVLVSQLSGGGYCLVLEHPDSADLLYYNGTVRCARGGLQKLTTWGWSPCGTLIGSLEGVMG